MKRAPKTLLILVALLCFAGLLKATLPQTMIGKWTSAIGLSQPRANADSVILSNGSILFAGGDVAGVPLQSAEVFGTDGTVSSAGTMNVPRSRHFAVVMSDGRVLVGGGNTTGGGTTNSAEIYDPSTGDWTATSPMNSARANATAALLQDGRVVIAGGDNAGAPSNTIETYDPSSGNFSVVSGNLSASRTKHAMAVLNNGQVLIIGGFDGTNPLASTDVFDPVAGTIAAGPALATARYSASATTLLNGQVAVIGGAGSDGNGGTTDLASIELFDPTSGAFSTLTATLTTTRQGHEAFVLPNNNNVLITGGTTTIGSGTGATEQAIASSELLTGQVSISDGSWTYGTSVTGTMNAARAAFSGSANQQNGPTSKVPQTPGLVLVGGGTDASGNTLASTELYAYPTVQTDQSDYPPFTTVNMTGGGFQPGETVTVSLVESPLIDTWGPYTITADANGNISDSSFETDAHDVGVRFYLTAVGSKSGWVAQNTFTDSINLHSISVGSQSPATVPPGTSATYTVTGTFTGSGMACNAALSVISGLPTGAGFSFSPTSISSANPTSSSLTITTNSATTPPGSSTFTVQAAQSGGCSGNVTNTGTLVVVENTTTTLATSLIPSTYGQSITLTAAVAQVTGPTTPTGGTVTFFDGATQIGTGTLTNGTATLSTSTLTAGSHSLTASYGGVANTLGASTSSALTQTVSQAGTTTTVSNASGTANQGSATLTANVKANNPSTETVNEGTVTFTVKQGATTIGTVTSGTVSGGAASANFPLTGVSSGSYSINATYNPATTNPNFTTSTAATPGTLTVSGTNTTTTVTWSTATPVFGQSVTFTAKIAPPSGTTLPTGTVQFVVDGSNFGAPASVASCSPSPDACATSVSTSTLSVGSHTVAVNYSGDGNYNASSGSQAETVGKAATSTVLTSSVNPSVFGQSVTFTATVTVTAPGAGTITGETVTFNDNGSSIGSGTTNASGVATFTTSSLSVATHPITAIYGGDTNFATSTSNSVSQVVNKAATATTIANATALATATVVGQSYSVSVSVSMTAPGGGTIPNTDTVTVSDGTATCTVTLTSAAGSCNLTSTTAGAKTITATYNGDANFSASTSAGVSHTVSQANTTTTITSNAPNPSTVGTAVTTDYALAVVAPGSGTPTGTVTVSDGSGDTCSASVAAGTCSITFNTAGTFTLTATYAGDTNFNGSSSSGTSQTVNPKLIITSAQFTTITGICEQITTQTQNINGSGANGARTLNLSATGSGKFYSDAACSSVTSTASILANASTASFFFTDTAIESSTLTVSSTGLASASQSETFTSLRFGTTAFSVALNACSPAITLQSANAQSGNPTALTQNATINLSTSSSGKYYSDSVCTTQITSTTIGPSTDAGHDSPSFFYKDTSAGSPTLTGSAGTAAATQAETITKLTPTFTVPASQSITFGTASITLSGTIASGTSVPPSGETVSVTINSVSTPATIGTNGAFSAVIDTHAIPASATPYTITYSYPGDANFNAASNTATTLTVNKGTTSTGLTSTPNPSFSGQQVTFTATVTLSTGAGVPTGSVQFVDTSTSTTLGTAALSNDGGIFSAQLQTSALSVGTHNVTATYSGDTNFGGGGGSISQVVNNPATTLTVASASGTYGGTATLSATLTFTNGGAPVSGRTISFTLNGNAAGSATTDPSGIATVSGASLSGISAGIYNTGVGASFAGNTTDLASSGSNSLTVSQESVTITLGNLTQTYDGMPEAVMFAAMPNLGGVVVTYTGLSVTYAASQNPPTGAGTYTVTASTTDPNFMGSASGTLTISPATPTINWSNPADISYGIALSATQLNATATSTFNSNPVPGTFTYSPVAGTILSAGMGQTLSTAFAPNDTVDFNSVPVTTATINVKADPLYVISPDNAAPFGSASTSLTPTMQGLKNGDMASNVGSPMCNASAATTTLPGTYAIVCSGVTSVDYMPIYINGTLTITNPLASITAVKDKNGDTTEMLQIGQADQLTAFGQFADGSKRALAGAGGMSFSRATLSTPLVGAAVAEAGGTLYAIGGSDGSNTLNTIQAYNPKTNSWSQISATLAAKRMNAAVASAAGRIYVIGGNDGAGTQLSSIEVLDTTGGAPAISAFSRTLTTARSNAAAAVWNQKLYVIGGSDGPLSSVEIFDFVTGNASTGDTATQLGQASAAVVTTNSGSTLYVVGTNGSSLAVLSTTDGTNWNSVSSVPGGFDSTQGVGAAASNGLLYIVNGANVWSYDGTNFAELSNPLSNPHNGSQPAAIGSRIYVASVGSGTPSANLDAFAPAEVNWSSTGPNQADATIDQSGNVTADARTDNASPTYATLTATSITNNSITGSFQLTINRKSQTVNFGTLSNQTYGASDFMISASSVDSSSNPTNLLVSFAAGATDSCTVGASTLSSGTSTAMLHITGAGSCTITASQPGDSTTWQAASPVMQSFPIAKATAMVVVTPYTSPGTTYTGLAHMATVTSIMGVNGEMGAMVGTVDVSNTTHTAAGTYASDYWFFTGTANYNNIGNTTITDSIAQAPLTITAASASMFYGQTVPAINAGNATYASFVDGESVSVLGAGFSCGTTATSLSPVGTYPTICSGAADSNYTIGYTPNTFVTVSPASTSTLVSSSPNPSNWMDVVTITATVSNTSPGSGVAPTGSVAFYYNTTSGATCAAPGSSTLLNTVPLATTVSGQQASTSTASLPVGGSLAAGYTAGTDYILACYNANSADQYYNANFVSSSGTTAQTVNTAPIATLAPNDLSFGNQQAGTTSNSQTVTLSNATGTAPLALSISFTGTTPTWFTQTNTCGSPIAAGGSCTISVKFAPPLNSTGVGSGFLTVTDNSGNVQNSTQMTSLTGAGLTSISDQSLYTNAIFATATTCGSITLSGGSTVDSFKSNGSPGGVDALTGGNVGTNGNVTLSGGKTIIYGTASSPLANTGGNCNKTAVTGLSTSGGARANEGFTQLSGPLTYPAPPVPNPAPPTTTQNISGSCPSGLAGCTNTGNKTVTLAPGLYGNLTLSGGTIAHVSMGTYNINSLKLSGNSTLHVDSEPVGPVVINLAAASLSGANQAMDASGGSLENTTYNPANLQFTYAGSRGVTLSGGSNAFATVYAPNALVNFSGGSDFYGSVIGSTITNSGGTSVHYDANLPFIKSGNTIWFNAEVKNVNLNNLTSQVKLYMTNSSVSFAPMSGVCPTGTTGDDPQNLHSTVCTLAVPNAVIIFNSAAVTSGATTSYDSTNNRWVTNVAKSAFATGNNTFVGGIAYPVPVDLPTGIQNVSWSAAFSSDAPTTPGISFQWHWGAAVYTSFGANSSLGVNPEDGSYNAHSPDPAGTPENFKQDITFGGTGGGLSSYTGYPSTNSGIVPTLTPMSVSPSSDDNSTVTAGSSATMGPYVLTNNSAVSHSISSISIVGTNQLDFTILTNTCPVGGSLAAGGNCSITVQFAPTATSGTGESAKVVIKDDATNSPQTVYLSGTVQ